MSDQKSIGLDVEFLNLMDELSLDSWERGEIAEFFDARLAAAPAAPTQQATRPAEESESNQALASAQPSNDQQQQATPETQILALHNDLNGVYGNTTKAIADHLWACGYRKALAPAAPVAEVTAQTDRMTEHKTNHIMERDGFQKVGYVLQKPGGDYCLSAQSAVRWLDQKQYWRLMHEQDDSLFGVAEHAKPEPVKLSDRMRADIDPEDFGVPAEYAVHARNYAEWLKLERGQQAGAVDGEASCQ